MARSTTGILPSAADLEQRIESAAAHSPRGFGLFGALGCADCHVPPTFTTADRFDVGIVDENGLATFNPPSLIGISQRQQALLHDASADSVRAVLDAEHQIDRNLSEEDRKALLEFLRAL